MKKTISLLVLMAVVCTGCAANENAPVHEVKVISENIAGTRQSEKQENIEQQEVPAEDATAQKPPAPKQEKKAVPEKPELSEEEIAVAAKVDELRKSAVEKYGKDRDAEGAIKDLQSALELKPSAEIQAEVRRDISKLYVLHALRLAHQKKFEESMPFFQKAFEADPAHAFAYFEHGATLRKMGRNKEAIEAFSRAIEHKPDYHEAYNARGLIRMNLGETEKALADFDKALELSPEFAWALINKGLILLNGGKVNESVELFDKAIEISPKIGLAYNNRGWARYQLEEYGKAIGDLSTALKLSPELDMAYLNRASAYAKIGFVDMAIKDVETFLDRFPDHAKAAETRKWLEEMKKTVEHDKSHDKENKAPETREPEKSPPLKKPQEPVKPPQPPPAEKPQEPEKPPQPPPAEKPQEPEKPSQGNGK